MKIFIVTQTFPPKVGGMQELMSSIANGLSKLNYDVSVFPDHFFYRDKLSYKVYNTNSPKLTRSFFKKIKIYFKSNNDDIFICDSWKSVSAVPKGKIIICFALAQELLVRQKKERKIQKAFNRCRYVVPISNFTLSLINSRWFVEENKIKVINPTFSIEPKKLSKRTIFEDSLCVFSLCRIEKRKGLSQVAYSLIRLKNSLPDFKWYIAGDGDAKEELFEIIRDSKIKKNVFFEGIISEDSKDLFFRKSDLFIMPSYQEGVSLEGYGITYSEAASYSVPSISGVDGGVRDAVINNYTGWCINPNNKNEIDNAIIDSFNNHKKRLIFGKNALNYFKKHHSNDRAFKKLVALF